MTIGYDSLQLMNGHMLNVIHKVPKVAKNIGQWVNLGKLFTESKFVKVKTLFQKISFYYAQIQHYLDLKIMCLARLNLDVQ